MHKNEMAVRSAILFAELLKHNCVEFHATTAEASLVKQKNIICCFLPLSLRRHGLKVNNDDMILFGKTRSFDHANYSSEPNDEREEKVLFDSRLSATAVCGDTFKQSIIILPLDI